VGLDNLGSESETCVSSRVHLVGISISFEKNFYRLPFTPPPLVRRIGPSKMTLQFERKYTTHGSGAPCHVSFGFFSGFFGIILQKLQMDPQPESRTQPKARELLHMECDFAIALPYQLRLQDNTGIVEDLQEQHSRTLGTT
jgi:hypothetical protein